MKYQVLLDGLDITIFNYKEIFDDNVEFRIDAEYYQKEYLHIYEKLQGAKTLGELVYMSDVSSNGAFAYVYAILNDGNPKSIPYIRSGNVGNTFINTNELELISQQAHQKLPKSTTKLHDVMMARKGKIGGASIITENEVNFNCNENVIKLTIYNKEYNPFYFTTFFNSKFGLKQVERISTGNVQPWVSIFQIKKLLIPKLDITIQQEIENVIRKSHNAITIAKQKYTEAESLLLENLGLENFQTASETVNIKSLKESFLQTGRLDAEFYQPFYEQLEKFIKDHSSGFDKLGNLCKLHDGNYTPKVEQEYDYIELSNIGKSGEITSSTKALGKDLPSRARRKARSNQVIISSIEGSLQSCAIVPPKYDNALCSTGFYVLSSDVMNAETLLVLFKSSLMQQILKKNCSGTILTAINKEELLNIPLPIISQNTQEKIAEYIRQSNDFRQQAQNLLAQAKNSVEFEIENNSLNINELGMRGGGGRS